MAAAIDLYKKYDVVRLSASMDEKDETPDLTPVELDDDDAIALANTTEQGRPDTDYINGRPRNRDRTAEFSYHARGIKGDPGVYWQTYVSDPLVKSTVDAGYEGLCSGDWSVDIHEDTPEIFEDPARKQAKFCKRTLLGSPKSWKNFLKSWNYGDRVYGFSLWEIIDREDGGIKKLAFRRPGTVDKWLFSQDGRQWAGTQFDYVREDPVQVSSDNLLLYTTGVGLDLEGLSSLRPIVRWVEIKQLITQIETAAAEAHGNGLQTVRDPEGKASQKDIDKLIAEIEAAHATDDAILSIGRFIYEWHSPGGRLPDFEALRRYCDEQISLALQSTGSLIGIGEGGTYNLAEVKDNVENIRRIRFYGQSVCDLINEVIIPRIIHNAFDGPVAPGLYPQLAFSLASEAKDPKRYDRLTKLVKAGVLTWTIEDENQLRNELDLSPRTDDGNEPDASEASTEEEGDSETVEASHGCTRMHTVELSQTHGERLELKHFDHIALSTGYDPDKLNKWIEESNNSLGRALKDTARKHRDEYVQLTSGVSDPQRLANISRRVRDKYTVAYKEAVSFELNRLIVKGSASQLRELGVLKAKQGTLPLPKVPKDPSKAARTYNLKPLSDQFHRHVELQASRIGKHAYNVTEHYLEQQAVRELPANVPERKKPDIPDTKAFTKMAGGYTARSFSYGRDQIVRRIQAEAEARGIDDTRVVAEYSSVLERESTCEPCGNADGTRCFLGSGTYERKNPPNLCEGADACRCMWAYLLASEQGYEDILEDLRNGGSKTTGYTLSNLQDNDLTTLVTLVQKGLEDA